MNIIYNYYNIIIYIFKVNNKAEPSVRNRKWSGRIPEVAFVDGLLAA